MYPICNNMYSLLNPRLIKVMNLLMLHKQDHLIIYIINLITARIYRITSIWSKHKEIN